MPPDFKEYTTEWYHNRMGDIIAKKITLLRERIEWWSHKNGYENMDNASEHRDDKGRLIWKQSDWEYVDDTYNHYINDKDYYPHPATLKKMNLLWKKYYITVKV
tara:strand:- start:205 stop:516 length:312 start_codon:yes stop_codon:yes gene_type:complete